ncbi:high-affinity nickel transporter [Histoplasma capsulatum G186AR]|uniref:High-affinity nickel transporter n=2 Tax=Ajellomyces capsulatus TaxID=5037 RepID=C0NM06_AJECG|nr:high-affinity nickel transporter [Histoplasma capsulatum G186AR]EEH07657.1 high-affinity nickel transporter [Histoplasma capsulatum G186AR]KAG5304205.1 high-affinity nickel transporter [Histoplasma capsulatum]QSS69804.1 high-affinity nickel transporter [Histoplasma capsulatum G186AR]
MAERTATASGTDNPASSSPVLTSVAAQENERGGDLEYDEAAAEPERIQGGDDGNTKPPRRGIAGKVEKVHSRVPALRKIPLAALGIIFLVAVVNGFVWMVAGIVLSFYPSLISTAVLSYTLGLRHALDADHISAIDLMTRRLLATGQRAVSVGTFFSLGHSTIVIITAVVVAATATAVSSKFDQYSRVGGIIGSSVSSAFLILLGIMNAYILYKLVQQMKKMLRLKEGQEHEVWKVEGKGVLFTVLKKMFKLIDRPWKMYPLGVLFGLGFDTSSEVALLGISSIEATRGTSIWVILIFPFLFTAGMCLLDTIDGALMLSLYVQPAENFLPSKSVNSSRTTLSTPSSGAGQPLTTSDAATANPSRNPRNPIAFLYYSIVLTSLTVIVATVIGTIQLLTLILNVTEATGRFWNGVEVAGEYYDVIGGSICGCFILVGGLSVLVYPSWRRWVAQRHELQDQNVDGTLEEGGGHEGEVEAGYGIATTSPTGIFPGAGMGSLKGDRGEDGKGQVGRVSVEERRLS